jgi:ribonuclease HI
MNTTTSFSLHIITQNDRSAWALCRDVDGENAQPVATGVIDGDIGDAERGRILTEVIDYLVVSEPIITGGLVDLYVFDTAARQTLRDLGGEFGPISVLARSQMRYREGWDRSGWRACLDLLGGIDSEERAELSSRRIDAATDGSFSRGRLASGASCAWIREDGLFGMTVLEHGGILEAELFGIRQLLAAAAPGERLRVFVDSRNALSCILSTPGEGRERASNQAEDIVRSIHQLMEKLDVEFEWVKGHQGHPLNDGADRLAVLARRSRNAVTHTTRSSIARNIVDSALSSHRAHAAPHTAEV